MLVSACTVYVSGVMASAKKKQLVAKWINILEGNYEFSFPINSRLKAHIFDIEICLWHSNRSACIKWINKQTHTRSMCLCKTCLLRVLNSSQHTFWIDNNEHLLKWKSFTFDIYEQKMHCKFLSTIWKPLCYFKFCFVFFLFIQCIVTSVLPLLLFQFIYSSPNIFVLLCQEFGAFILCAHLIRF